MCARPQLQFSNLASTASSVPSMTIVHWANVCFSAHAIGQQCRRTTSEAFQAL